jgi:hypothetical protein
MPISKARQMNGSASTDSGLPSARRQEVPLTCPMERATLRRCGLWAFAVRKRSSVAAAHEHGHDTSVIIDILRGLTAAVDYVENPETCPRAARSRALRWPAACATLSKCLRSVFSNSFVGSHSTSPSRGGQGARAQVEEEPTLGSAAQIMSSRQPPSSSRAISLRAT